VAETSNIQLLANIGLGFLFLLAGYELDPGLLRQRPGKLAIVGWLISAVLAVGVTAGLGAAGELFPILIIAVFLTGRGNFIALDLKAIAQNPLRLLTFFLLLLIIRGLPSLLVYRRALAARQRVEMTFITATTLPLLIALVEIGQRDGVMLPANAAALVGAGVLSVLVFPLVAVVLHRTAPMTPADVGITTAEPAARTSAPPDDPGPDADR